MSYSKATKQRLKIAARLKEQPEDKFETIDLATSRNVPRWMTRAFRNNRYTVMINDNACTTKGAAIRAMIQAHDDRPIPNHWSEMQRIKNEIFGPETVAVEYYPAESKKVDDYNVYWMWIFPDGVLPLATSFDRKPISEGEVRMIAKSQTKIEPKYFIGTTAFHLLGDISRQESLFRASGETDKYWVGMWVEGFGFFDVLFPKESSRELTESEREHYNKTYVQIGSQMPMKLNIPNPPQQ